VAPLALKDSFSHQVRMRMLRRPGLTRSLPISVQDVFPLPGHLALVTQWANCGSLQSYITSYTRDNVR
jgi:hypothetical protein